MEIDYAATYQIPWLEAWLQSVWLQVGQACLREALLAGLDNCESAKLLLQGHTACYHGKLKIFQPCKKEWRYPS